MAESQLNTIHGLAILAENAFTDSVFPVPAGPCGFDDFYVFKAETRVE